MPIARTNRRIPVWIDRLRKSKMPSGLHGTRRWNANEIMYFGSSEIYFYEIPKGTRLGRMSNAKIARRLANSIRGNVYYWEKNNVPNIREFLKESSVDDLPAIVIHKKPEYSLKDENWNPASEKEKSFQPYSSDIESGDVKGVLAVTKEEFDSIKKKIKRNQTPVQIRQQVINLLTAALQRKIIRFFSERH